MQELKSLKFKKDLGVQQELKSLKFKKNLGKSLPEHVRSSRMMNEVEFQLTKLGTNLGTFSNGMSKNQKIVITIMLIVFLVIRLKLSYY